MSAHPNSPVLKIAVMADGRITVDGSPTTIDSLRVSLQTLAKQQGVVWYYREAGQAKACPQQEAIETGGYFNSVRGSPVAARQALPWRFWRGRATIAPYR